jgi:hypothetical protein
MKNQLEVCERILKEYEKRFDPSDLALIYLQYPNPAFKGPSKEEAALKNHPYLGRFYWFASLTKGLEFLAGVIFVSDSFLARDMGPKASILRANILYVAMSRFRDELIIVYPKGTPIASVLSTFANVSLQKAAASQKSHSRK